jgi:NAD+ dependent glucose-6-phosphate dehydrogenase
MSVKKILVTGVYGLIGNLVYRHLANYPEVYEVYGTARRRQHSDRLLDDQVYTLPEERFFLADLADFNRYQQIVQGMDVIVHMAADPSGVNGWESVLQNNVIGAYHVFEASRLAGVKRIIFASSVQVSFGYGVEEPFGSILEGKIDAIPAEIPIIDHGMPNRPMNIYAASKVWGEALAHMYAYKHGMSCIVLRIGWVVAEDRPRAHAGSDWCSWRDINQLVQQSIDAPESLKYDVFYGVSDNRFGFLDIEHAHEVLGYLPEDRAEERMK